MASPLAGSLALTIGGAMKGLFLDATLTRVTVTPGSDPWAGGTETTETFACKAIHDKWGSTVLAGGLVASGERKILVLASTLATVPKPMDRITLKGETFTIVPPGAGKPPVETDPATAVWELRCKS